MIIKKIIALKFSYIIMLWFAANISSLYAQEITLTQQILAEKTINDYCQYLIDYSKGNAKSRIVLENLMGTKSNKVYNDIGNGGLIDFKEYLNLFMLQKHDISFSEVPPKDQWQVGTKGDQQYLIVTMIKYVDSKKKTNIFFINPGNQNDNINIRITNIYNSLPEFLTYKKLTDAPSFPSIQTEIQGEKRCTIFYKKDSSNFIFNDSINLKDINKDSIDDFISFLVAEIKGKNNISKIILKTWIGPSDKEDSDYYWAPPLSTEISDSAKQYILRKVIKELANDTKNNGTLNKEWKSRLKSIEFITISAGVDYVGFVGVLGNSSLYQVPYNVLNSEPNPSYKEKTIRDLLVIYPGFSLISSNLNRCEISVIVKTVSDK